MRNIIENSFAGIMTVLFLSAVGYFGYKAWQIGWDWLIRVTPVIFDYIWSGAIVFLIFIVIMGLISMILPSRFR